MARNAGLNVVITGDARGLEKATKQASGHLDKLGKQSSVFGRLSTSGFSRVGVAASGMTAGIGAAAVGVGFLVKQFEESHKIAKQTDAVLKSTGGAANVTAKHVSDLATAISKKTGVDDEAIQSGENLLLTFTKVRNETGKGNKIFDQATRVVTDMSAALGQDTKSSAIQLGKALNDPIKGVTALQRVGVSFTKGQKDQIKSLEESGHHMQAQKVILRELNKEFRGSAAAQATPFDKLKVSAGNLAETLGGKLAPILGKAANFLNKFLNQMQDGTGAGGKFVRVIVGIANTLKNTWKTAVAAAGRWIDKHRADIQSVIQAFKRVATFARTVFQETLLPIIRRNVAAIKPIFEGLVSVIRGVVRLVSGLLSGNWSKAWSGAKEVVAGAWKAIKTIVTTEIGNLFTILKTLGPKLVKLIVKGIEGLGKALATGIWEGIKAAGKAVPGLAAGALKGIGHTITSGISKGFGKLNPFGDGLGRPPSGGSVGSLDGARPSLAPFAAIGARFGLHVSDGKRPAGTRTASGGVSYHSTGEAIDMADGRGPDANKLGFFNYLKNAFGGSLAELIYTPGGVGIKDGRPFRYTGAVAADHYDHVHVAFDSGRPGLGDGLGKFSATSYGPPWGGIQGGGTTATGVNLHNNPHKYGIAVDPSVIPLGSKVKVWPNPFGYRGAFTAFDTGGAIKGHRIDFYDWRGRAAQNGWGVRNVTVSTATGSSGGRGRKPKFSAGVVGSGFGGSAGFATGGGSGKKIHGSGGFGAGATDPAIIGDTPGYGFGQLEAQYDMQAAQAALTPGLGDDLSVATARRGLRETEYSTALATHDPKTITAAATALKEARDAVSELTDEIKAANDIAQERADIEKEDLALRKQILTLTQSQGPQLIAGLAAILSGGIGGKVALGFQTPGYSGGGVRY